MNEKAIFTHLPFHSKTKGHSIVYTGSESCCNLALKSLNEFKFDGSIIFCLPIISDKGLNLFDKKINNLVNNKKIRELVLNDIGSVIYFRKKYKKLKINIGRILTLYFQKNFMFENSLKRFVYDFNINAIEVDASICYKKIFNVAPLCYHKTYSIAAVTRFCPWEKVWNSEKCNFTCNQRTKKLSSLKLGYDLYLKGCAYYQLKDYNDNFFRIVEHI